jgi:hypothetical protein
MKNTQEKIKKYVSKLSPVKKVIGEKLIAGVKPDTIAKQLSKGRKNTANAKAWVTMVQNGFNKIEGIKPEKTIRKNITKLLKVSFGKIATIKKESIPPTLLKRFDKYASSISKSERLYNLSAVELFFSVQAGVDPATDALEINSKEDKALMAIYRQTKNCEYLKIV